MHGRHFDSNCACTRSVLLTVLGFFFDYRRLRAMPACCAFCSNLGCFVFLKFINNLHSRLHLLKCIQLSVVFHLNRVSMQIYCCYCMTIINMRCISTLVLNQCCSDVLLFTVSHFFFLVLPDGLKATPLNVHINY